MPYLTPNIDTSFIFPDTNPTLPQFEDATASRQAISADGRYVTFRGEWEVADNSCAGDVGGAALKADGTVGTWGFNAYGQLGNNTTTDSSVPVPVQGLSGVVAIAGGYTNSVALKADGTVWGWGYNGFGQLGNNTTTDAHLPVPATGLSGVGAIAAGYHHVLAVKGDGTVSAWGYNGLGQLGNNTVTDAHAPQAVPGLTGVRAATAGGYSSDVLKGEGTLWAWGYDAYGQLGLGTTTDAHTPTQVGGLSGLLGQATGPIHTLALKPDGTAAAWGWNGTGAVGDGTTTDAHSPVAVSGFASGTAPQAAYAYRGDGLRTSKTVAGRTSSFVWDESGPVPRLLSDGGHTYVYGPDGVPVEQVDPSGAVQYLHHDQLGSTRLVTDATGNVVATYT